MESLETHSDIKNGERLYPKSFQEAWLDHQERYFLALQYIKSGDIILDAAMGSGYGISFLTKNSGCNQAIGMDISEHAIEWANEHFNLPNALYMKADFNNDFVSLLPINEFDIITSFETIEHLEDPRPFLKQLHQILKYDGKLLLSTPNEDVIPLSVGKNPHHYKHYTSAEFQKLVIESGFYIIDCYAQSPIRAEKGDHGFYNVLVCGKKPTTMVPPSVLDKAIAQLQSLRIQEEYSILRTNAYYSLEFVGLDIRLQELLQFYEKLVNASKLFDEFRLDEVEMILSEIDKSLCPESYLWDGMVCQARGDNFKAIENYGKILQNKQRYNVELVKHTEQLFAGLIQKMITTN